MKLRKHIALVGAVLFLSWNELVVQADLLFNKPAKSSSDYVPEYAAAKAVDGKRDSRDISNCWHSLNHPAGVNTLSIDMGQSTKVSSAHITSREPVEPWRMDPSWVTVGDNSDIRLNPIFEGLVITDSGWYNCEPALTGRYFGIWHQRYHYQQVCEVSAYSDKYVSHRAASGDQLSTKDTWSSA